MECGGANSNEVLLLEQARHTVIAGQALRVVCVREWHEVWLQVSCANGKLLFTVNASMGSSPIEISFCGHQKRQESKSVSMSLFSSRTLGKSVARMTSLIPAKI
jgi:hypothetical protein